MKRILALLLAMILCLSSVYVYAEEETENNAALNAEKVLRAIGITDKNNIDYEASVTRAELVYELSKLLGINEQIDDIIDTTLYIDVQPDYWASSSIYALTKLGILNGVGNGRFDPEGLVDANQAVKIFIALLGYDYSVDLYGGYPVGVLYVANSIGLTKNIDFSKSVFTYGDLLVLMHNAMDIDVVQQKSVGDREEYVIMEDETIYSKYLNIYTDKGIISANSYTALTGKCNLQKDEVMIDDKIYHMGDTDAIALLGHTVKFYYTSDKDKDERTLLYVDALQGVNNTRIINYRDIINYKDRHYQIYSDNARGKETFYLSQDFDLIYNGMAALDFTDADLKPTAGEVVLLDNNNNGEYDVVFVNNYTTYVVRTVNPEDEVIYDRFSNNYLDLNPTSKKVDVCILDSYGQETTLDKITEWNVLNVLESKDGSLITIRVSDEIINGNVTSISETHISIDDTEYYIAESHINQFNSIDPGLFGNFYLNISGEIVAVKLDGDLRYAYGYLIDFGSDNNTIDGRVDLKILTLDDDIRIFKTANKVRIDNAICKDQTSISDALLKKTITKESQVIRYATNSDGDISKIDTLYHNQAAHEDKESLYPLYSKVMPAVYKPVLHSLAGKVNVDENVKVFLVPYDKTQVYDNEQYKAVDINYLRYDGYYEFEAFSTTYDSFIPAVITIMKRDSIYQIEDATPMFLVDKVNTFFNVEDGTEGNKVSGYANGVYTEYITAQPNLLNNIETGDVIRFALDNKNRIIGQPKIEFKAKTLQGGDRLRATGFDFVGAARLVYGKVIEKRGNSICITSGDVANPTEDEIEYHLMSDFNIFLYDKNNKKGEIVTAKFSDIYDYVNNVSYSNVLVMTHIGSPVMMVIYK